MSKLRLSNHRLEIEVGRHTNVKQEERICQLCRNGVEDELHFIVQCTEYDELRDELLPKNILSNQNISDRERFIKLMCDNEIKQIGKYIFKSFELRQLSVVVINVIESAVTQVVLIETNLLNKIKAEVSGTVESLIKTVIKV